jgi:hypothetical protein
MALKFDTGITIDGGTIDPQMWHTGCSVKHGIKMTLQKFVERPAHTRAILTSKDEIPAATGVLLSKYDNNADGIDVMEMLELMQKGVRCSQLLKIFCVFGGLI